MDLKSYVGLIFSAVGVAVVVYDIITTYKRLKTLKEEQSSTKKKRFLYARIALMSVLFVFFAISMFFSNKQKYMVNYLKYNHAYERLKENCKNKEISALLFRECNINNIENLRLTALYNKCMIFGDKKECEIYLQERRFDELNLFK